MINDRDKKLPLEILHLEDSLLDAELIYQHLIDNFNGEIQLDLVSKEKEFILAINTKKYDLIISDFQLLNFDGFIALKHSKSICPFTPFICISGFIG